MAEISEIVAAYIEQHQLLPEQGTLVVAVSGGADSLCLLHLLQNLCRPGQRFPGVQLHVAHLNHQLRGSASSQDAEFVARIADQWGIPASFASIDVPALAQNEKRSIEEAAREARYHFLRSVAQQIGAAAIAVAHHMDDQAETLLLHMLRGGGIASMVGLQPRHQDIIRPLLAITHADAIAYCHQHQISYHEDESNTDPRYLRNRIRHELLPLLESLNPGIRGTLVHNAEAIRPDIEWIEAQVDACWPQVVESESVMSIDVRVYVLLRLPPNIRRH